MILVVDDDLDIRNSLADSLRVEGYEVTTAENGEKAFHLIEQGLRPDLILLDLLMPKMNGWEFLDAIKEQPQYSAIPVLVSSAMTSKSESVHSAAAFIQKPLDLISLLEFVRKYCGPPTEKSA